MKIPFVKSFFTSILARRRQNRLVFPQPQPAQRAPQQQDTLQHLPPPGYRFYSNTEQHLSLIRPQQPQPNKVETKEVKPATEREVRAMYAAADPRVADLSHMSMEDRRAVFAGAHEDENAHLRRYRGLWELAVAPDSPLGQGTKPT